MKLIEDRLKIGKVELANRIIMPPIATSKCDLNGKVSQDLVEYYEERAKNPNVSMIITEHAYIAEEGKASPNMMSVSDDSDIDGMKKLVAAIHKHGKIAICQINHGGSDAYGELFEGRMVSPSGINVPGSRNEAGDVKSSPLSVEQIKVLIDKYVDAAKRVKEAGYDGVEIHSAHGYLLNQFYSPLTNKRDDSFGGSLDNRIRIHREVIKRVREELGEDYLIALRLGASDYMDGGSTIEDAVYVSKVFEKDGIDLLDISGGMCRFTKVDDKSPGYFKDASSAIKNSVSIPVILTGGVKSLEEADKLLKDRQADLIGVGRSLMKDANWSL